MVFSYKVLYIQRIKGAKIIIIIIIIIIKLYTRKVDSEKGRKGEFPIYALKKKRDDMKNICKFDDDN